MTEKRMIVAELWSDFGSKVVPRDASLVQRQEMRRAFYAGAQGLLYAILKVLEEGEDPTEGDLATMSGIERELSDFAHLVKAGRA